MAGKAGFECPGAASGCARGDRAAEALREPRAYCPQYGRVGCAAGCARQRRAAWARRTCLAVRHSQRGFEESSFRKILEFSAEGHVQNGEFIDTLRSDWAKEFG